MPKIDRQHSFLLEQFRVFYTELAAVQNEIQTELNVPQSDQGDVMVGRSDDVRAVHNRLRLLLDSLEAEARHASGSLGYQLYRDVQYAMVALADEILLTTDWAGRDLWSANLLESACFKSQIAGKWFFEKVNEIIVGRDQLYVDVAKVYLMALALGFEGKYRGDDEAEKRLEECRRQLYTFVARRQPKFSSGSRRFFPEAYEYTFDKGQPEALPDPRQWVFGLAAILTAMLIVSAFLWNDITRDIFRILSQIGA